jgi:hypothetical protein
MPAGARLAQSACVGLASAGIVFKFSLFFEGIWEQAQDNCFVVFAIFGMFFGVLLKNGWEEQSKTIHTPNTSALQNAGKNNEEQSPDKKDIARRRLPGRWERAEIKENVISSAAIIAQMF